MFGAPWRPNDMTKPDKVKVVQSDIKVELETSSAESNLATLPKSLVDDKNTQEGTQLDSDDSAQVKEVGGPKGLEPTRYGDWESKGRCYDF